MGFDDIDAYILKMVKSELTPAITHIVNMSIRSSVFPSIWKYSKVIPLLKPGGEDQLNPKSYRPVALLPVVSKVLERVVFLQIVEYMDKNGLFHPNHHGFRSLHSTTTVMVQMYDTWVGAISRGEMVGVAMIDQSAAIVSGRKQSCRIESFTSPSLAVSVGVP